MNLIPAIYTSESGMIAQAERMKVVAENIANKDTTPPRPGMNPYTRKTIFFSSEYDPKLKAEVVRVRKIGVDSKTPYNMRYLPSHPAANDAGYVLYPNINETVEIEDSKEASLHYQANLSVLSMLKNMIMKTIGILSK